MRFTNTFLLIALLTISFTNSFEFASFAEVNEITASPYGKSLLETISLSLEQKGNVNEIEKLLNDLLFKLNADQARDTAAWKKENARLKAKIARLTKEIEALRLEIIRLLAEKAKYEKLRDQAAKNLIQYKAQRAHNVKALAANDKRRADDAAEFKKSQEEHTDVLNALDAVTAELSKLTGSVSGAGKPEHVRQNEEEARDLKNAFVQISQDEAEVQAFIQMATEADQNALRNLIAAIAKIRASTQKSYNDDVNHEKNSVTAHANLKALLVADNLRLDAMIKEETANHAKYVKKVAELTIKIAETRKLRKAKIAEKAATIAERIAKEKKYLADKAQRDEERRVIKRIMEIVKRRLANMSKYLNEQLD